MRGGYKADPMLEAKWGWLYGPNVIDCWTTLMAPIPAPDST
jgi:hypothetical protein